MPAPPPTSARHTQDRVTQPLPTPRIAMVSRAAMLGGDRVRGPGRLAGVRLGTSDRELDAARVGASARVGRNDRERVGAGSEVAVLRKLALEADLVCARVAGEGQRVDGDGPFARATVSVVLSGRDALVLDLAATDAVREGERDRGWGVEREGERGAHGRFAFVLVRDRRDTRQVRAVAPGLMRGVDPAERRYRGPDRGRRSESGRRAARGGCLEWAGV